MKLMRKNGGFTLVELIVVIAILAILAGIAVPAYSGYIQKAEKAADMQLLGAVNQAFASACLLNDTHPTEVGNASASVSGGTVDAVSPYGEDFFTFFAGNENTAFKQIKALTFNPATGCFEEALGQTMTLPSGGKVFVTNEQLALLQSSTYATDIAGLMTQVDNVGSVVSGLLAQGGTGVAEEVLGAYLTDPSYLTGAIAALGGTVDPENEDLLGQYVAVVDQFKEEQAKQQIAEKYNKNVEDIDLADYPDEYDAVSGQVDKNILIMSVAQNASTQKADDVMSIINSANPKTELINAMKNGADGMGQAALVYGAFTAYAMSDSGSAAAKSAIANTDDPTAVFDLLVSGENGADELAAFQAYMAKDAGKNDLNACIEAMDVINNTSKDQEATAGLMANGFNNTEFVDALNGLLGSSNG